MLIQFNSDASAALPASLASKLETRIRDAVAYFVDNITRIEVHLSQPGDYRVLLEARVAGMQPMAVDAEGLTPEEATAAGADKLERLLTTAIGRRQQH